MQAGFRGLFVGLAIIAGLAVAGPGRAQPDDDLARLRGQVEAMRQEYEARMSGLGNQVAALEKRVETAEAEARQARAAARDSARTALVAPAVSSPAPNAFNPDISLIMQGRLAGFSGTDGHRGIPGFLLGEETGVGPEGFSLGESELVLSANIDDRFYGFFNLAFNHEDGESELEIEEAYLQTLALPLGLGIKAGQFFSSIGYHNARHSHTWDFVDAPLAYEAFLGTQYLDPGIQLSWIAPTDLYLELGAELFRGDSFPAGGAGHGGVGTVTAFAKLGGDLGVSTSWKAGLAYLMADPRERASSGGAADPPLFFTGDSELLVADLTVKWAPGGNLRERSFVFQAEFLHRREQGQLQLGTPDPGGPISGRYRGDQDGFYVQAITQFMPRWRVGLRYGQLHADNRVTGLVGTPLEADNATPRRISAMLDFSNSEFSRLRLQYNHDAGALGDQHAVFLQYIMSLGAHGAHQF